MTLSSGAATVSAIVPSLRALVCSRSERWPLPSGSTVGSASIDTIFGGPSFRSACSVTSTPRSANPIRCESGLRRPQLDALDPAGGDRGER